MAEHKLKTWHSHFEAIKDGRKTFECRKNDRDPPFAVGDTLVLLEIKNFSPEYTGRRLSVIVTYLLEGLKFGIMPGYCVMGIKKAGG